MLLTLFNYKKDTEIIEIPDDVIRIEVQIISGDESIVYETENGDGYHIDPFRYTRWYNAWDGAYTIFDRELGCDYIEEWKKRNDSYDIEWMEMET